VNHLSSGNRLGITFMIIAMIGFAIADSLIKLSSDTGIGGAGSGQIIIYLGASGVVLFAGIMAASGERLTRRTVTDRFVILRTAGDLVGVLGFITALTRMPVGDASAILQIQPIVVMLGAALFLKEVVTPRRWVAVVLGFVGVMIIVRPGFEAFHPASFFVLLAVFGLSVRDLATRALDPSHSSAAVSLVASIGLFPLGFALFWFGSDAIDYALKTNAILLLSSIFGVLAYYAITHAMRIGEVSAIAPFRYSRIVGLYRPRRAPGPLDPDRRGYHCRGRSLGFVGRTKNRVSRKLSAPGR